MTTRIRIRYVCVLVLSALALPWAGQAFSDDGESEIVRIGNPFFAAVGDSVIVTFDLSAPPDAMVDVSIVLRKSSDTTFAIVPVSVSGAVGKVQGGGRKAVFWEYRKDVPQGFQYASDYWFEITAVTEEEVSGLQWWHYAIGGAGLVTAAILLANGSDDSTAPTGLPDPPGTRPDGR